MEKSLKITGLKDKQSDYAFWISKTDEERLSAIELLRQQYIKSNPTIVSTFQMVCKITNRQSL